jgi:hypothetical protein
MRHRPVLAYGRPVGGDILKAMIQLLALVLTFASAQPLSRFERYCAQLATPNPEVSAHANSRIGGLFAVADAAQGIDRLMKESVMLGHDYAQFKERMAKKNIALNDHHEEAYARAARFKCDLLATEAGPGLVSNDGHPAPTTEQLGRRVDDSGIGVGGPANTGDSGTETER